MRRGKMKVKCYGCGVDFEKPLTPVGEWVYENRCYCSKCMPWLGCDPVVISAESATRFSTFLDSHGIDCFGRSLEG
jgi:hypothetical protein